MNSERNLKKMYLITGTVMTILMIGMALFIPSRDLGWLTLIDVLLAWVLIGVVGQVLYWPPLWLWRRLDKNKGRQTGSGTS